MKPQSGTLPAEIKTWFPKVQVVNRLNAEEKANTCRSWPIENLNINLESL